VPTHDIFWHAIPTAQERERAAEAMQMFGPRINVAISMPDVLAATLTASGVALPTPHVGFGLIDTGASTTSIDDDVAVALGLPVVDTISIATPTTVSQHPIYPARLTFPGTQLPPILFQRFAGTRLANQGIIALLGRDFLAGKFLHYDGVWQRVSLSW
jgi:hypothetical protein